MASSAMVVWMDGSEAKLFRLDPQEIVRSSVSKHAHHTHTAGGHQREDEKFFHDVAGKLRDASEVLLMGPGMTKNLFKTHLETHHHLDIFRKIVGTETVDHPTDKQILATARKFFKTYDLFEHP